MVVMLGGFGPPAEAVQVTDAGPRVVIVAVADLQWADVSPEATPALWRIAGRGSVGMLSVRALGFSTGCITGWLTLGAGNRAGATDLDQSNLCGRTLEGVADPVHMREFRELNKAGQFGARPGALGDALHAAGLGTAAAGDPGAWLAAADSKGGVDTVAPSLQGSWGQASLVVVGESALYSISPSKRAAAVAAIDRDVDLVSRALGPADSILIIGFSDQSFGKPLLHVAIADGPAWKRGLLRSASTGRTEFVQLIDVAPTALDLLGIARPKSMTGQSWHRAASRDESLGATAGRFAGVTQAADASRATKWLFLDALAVAQVLLYAAAFLLFRRLGRAGHPAPGALDALALGALSVAFIPAASFAAQIVPWWRTGAVLFYVMVVALCIAAGVVAFAAGRRWGPWAAVGAVAGGITLLLAADILTGTHLQLGAVLGDSPMLAGRFRGVGNIDFALFSTSALLAAAVAALVLRRAGRLWLGLAAAAAIAAGALVLDGAPPLGDDLGGALALGPAVIVLLFLLSGGRLSWRRFAAAVAAGAVPVVAFALYDYSQPLQSQTHIGRFVGQVIHGGALTVVRRKALTNLRQFAHPTFLVVLLVGMVVVAALTGRVGPRRGGRGLLASVLEDQRELRAGFIAAAVCGVLGGVFNDSGISVTVASISVALPLAVGLCALAVRAPPE
jgi:hypothetical protein